ncbi:MAG: transposase [Opitutales bacterium]
MARAPRIVFPGADYHVLSRGNYRKDLFTADVHGAAFLKTLLLLCQERGWRLHAYAVMSNHFHLCLRTPQADLPEGMQWLLSTFAARFNRFRGVTGHVFQGRYKALVIEPGPHLLRVVDYIHLNPVRAEVVSLQRLCAHRLCSYGRFAREQDPAPLDGQAWREPNGYAGAQGWQRYEAHLEDKLAGELASTPAQRRRDHNAVCRGWCVASERYREYLLQRMAQKDKKAFLNHSCDDDNPDQLELFSEEV